MRAAQIGLGAIAIILSTLILIHPAASIVSITVILSTILLVVGIERVLSGILVDNNSRWGSIGLGILVIIFVNISVIPSRHSRLPTTSNSSCAIIRWYCWYHTWNRG